MEEADRKIQLSDVMKQPCKGLELFLFPQQSVTLFPLRPRKMTP